MYRVLIVDDEPNVLASLRRLVVAIPGNELDGERPALDLLTSPRAALQRAQSVRYDLVLSDFRMPEMDGLRFLGLMRELQPDTVRMILTAYAEPATVMRAINSTQVFRFLCKPWDDAELRAAMTLGLRDRDARLQERHWARQGRKLEAGTRAARHLERDRALTRVERNSDGSIDLDWNEADDAPPLSLDWAHIGMHGR